MLHKSIVAAAFVVIPLDFASYIDTDDAARNPDGMAVEYPEQPWVFGDFVLPEQQTAFRPVGSTSASLRKFRESPSSSFSEMKIENPGFQFLARSIAFSD